MSSRRKTTEKRLIYSCMTCGSPYSNGGPNRECSLCNRVRQTNDSPAHQISKLTYQLGNDMLEIKQILRELVVKLDK